jgi:hypothetical protein
MQIIFGARLPLLRSVRGSMTEIVAHVRMGRYAALYAAWMIGISLVFIVVFLFFPDLAEKAGSSVSIVPKIVAAMMAYQTFVRKHARLVIREEYWEVVIYCAVVTFAWEAIVFAIALLGHALPDLSPATTIGIFVVFAGLVSFAVPAVGFRNFVGNWLLKAELKRRAISESRG